MLPNPTPHTMQLTLPIDLSVVPAPPALSIEQRLDPTQVWASLTGATQTQLRRAWLCILHEVIDDAPTD